MIRIESSVTIDRPISEVYAFVSDCRNEPKWHTDVIEATGETAVGAVQTWVLRFMGRRESNMKVSRLETERLEELQAQRSLLGMRPTISYLLRASRLPNEIHPPYRHACGRHSQDHARPLDDHQTKSTFREQSEERAREGLAPGRAAVG
jgi:hypothetical protein